MARGLCDACAAVACKPITMPAERMKLAVKNGFRPRYGRADFESMFMAGMGESLGIPGLKPPKDMQDAQHARAVYSFLGELKKKEDTSQLDLCEVCATQAKEYLAKCPRCFGTGFLSKCRLCHGKGRISCDCDHGKVKCQECDETGKIRCHACDGLGKRAFFFGLLKPECKKCRGTGQIVHSACNGSGKVTHSACQGQGVLSCSTCSGNGRMDTCPDCDGTGKLPE